MIEPLRALKMSALVGAALITTAEPVRAQDQAKERPNILVIMPDDVGLWNISAYNRGSRGYRTPSIDRLAEEGALFSDMYAQPSCTPGRASFITGMYPIRCRRIRYFRDRMFTRLLRRPPDVDPIEISVRMDQGKGFAPIAAGPPQSS